MFFVMLVAYTTRVTYIYTIDMCTEQQVKGKQVFLATKTGVYQVSL